MGKLVMEEWPIDKLYGYARNPRKNDAVIDRMKSSIAEFGFKIPILARSSGEIVDGHLRWKAAKAMGMETVPVTLADDLSDTQVKAFRLLANQSANWAAWDEDLLKLELEDLKLEDFDIGMIGFDDAVLPEELPPYDEEAADAVPEVQDITISRFGDIWRLGQHRLMCGDSTDAGSVALLMDGERADVTFTSPPYNMQATSISKAFESDMVKDTYGIKDGTYNAYSDALSDEDYARLLNGALDCCLSVSDEVLFNIGILAASKSGIVDMLTQHKQQFSDVIVWNKDGYMPLCLPTQIHLIGHICELIFCFSNSGTRAFSHSQWDLGMMHNRIDVKGQHKNEFAKIHHATFPVDLPAYVIKWFTDKSVLDCFGGTGSTLIAAEQLRRKSYTMELDPKYVDVIVRRWQDLTGKAAILEGDGRTFEEIANERG